MKISSPTLALCLLLIAFDSALVFSQVGADKRPTPPKTSTPKATSKKTTPPARTVRRTPTRTTGTNSENNPAAVELALWNSVKDSSNPDDYRAYLTKYPSGQFAAIAKYKIAALDTAAERSYWENIKNTANPEDLRVYLNKYPNGIYVDAARNQIDALERAAREEAARKEEAIKEEAKRKEDEARREKARRKEEAGKRRAGTIARNQMGMEMVWVPAGGFMMGSPASEAHRSEDEGPRHQVTIREGFYMGRYEVTVAQWTVIMGTNPSRFKSDNFPVGNVSWDDTQEFIRRMNARDDGYNYRLPTEAEWEYACRAGTNTVFAFGDSLSSEQANFDGTDPYGKAKKGVFRGEPTPVGSFQPNAWGLYDMHGNVWEWCEDWYHFGYDGAPTDGSAWLSGGTQKDRILRGGSWSYAAQFLRSAQRFVIGSFGGWSHDPYGFRVVATERTQ
ncbi:MAG: hypothetical protein QOJ64_1878 [Acidobacteriota bacterium]|jgi:formylglycine-generating enzyme required for sulfatase activity|nr:hypothetical protein [Acidobacteriota bacterium]